jgi:hypothetical protein
MLARRAAGDLYACRALIDDSEVEDSIIGFHAQQTVEKAMKVALVLAGVELPYTHDLESLAELIGTSGPDSRPRSRTRSGSHRGQRTSDTRNRSRLTVPRRWQRPRAPAARRRRCSQPRNAHNPILEGKLRSKLHQPPTARRGPIQRASAVGHRGLDDLYAVTGRRSGNYGDCCPLLRGVVSNAADSSRESSARLLWWR